MDEMESGGARRTVKKPISRLFIFIAGLIADHVTYPTRSPLRSKVDFRSPQSTTSTFLDDKPFCASRQIKKAVREAALLLGCEPRDFAGRLP